MEGASIQIFVKRKLTKHICLVEKSASSAKRRSLCTPRRLSKDGIVLNVVCTMHLVGRTVLGAKHWQKSKEDGTAQDAKVTIFPGLNIIYILDTLTVPHIDKLFYTLPLIKF